MTGTPMITIPRKVRAKPAFFVRFDSYWAGSASWFAGPFESRAAARDAIQTAIQAEGSLCVMSSQTPRDARYGIRIYGVLTRSDAVTCGLREASKVDHGSNSFARIPVSLHEYNDDPIFMEDPR